MYTHLGLVAGFLGGLLGPSPSQPSQANEGIPTPGWCLPCPRCRSQALWRLHGCSFLPSTPSLIGKQALGDMHCSSTFLLQSLALAACNPPALAPFKASWLWAIFSCLALVHSPLCKPVAPGPRTQVEFTV